MAEESTVGFVGMVKDGLDRLSRNGEKVEALIADLQRQINSLQMQKMQSLELSIVKMDGAITANEKAIASLIAGQAWLSRLVIGALVTGIIGGAVALVFRLAG